MLFPAQAAGGREAPLGSPLPAGLAALMDLLPCLLRKLQVAADPQHAACMLVARCHLHSDICTGKAQHAAHELPLHSVAVSRIAPTLSFVHDRSATSPTNAQCSACHPRIDGCAWPVVQSVRYDKIASVRQSCVAALLSLQRLAALHNRSDLAELPLESSRPCPRLTPRGVRCAFGDSHRLGPLTSCVSCMLLHPKDDQCCLDDAAQRDCAESLERMMLPPTAIADQMKWRSIRNVLLLSGGRLQCHRGRRVT